MWAILTSHTSATCSTPIFFSVHHAAIQYTYVKIIRTGTTGMMYSRQSWYQYYGTVYRYVEDGNACMRLTNLIFAYRTQASDRTTDNENASEMTITWSKLLIPSLARIRLNY